MTEESKRGYSKEKSWADHCSSDEESDDGLHPANLASAGSGMGNPNSLEEDLSYDDDSIEHISVTGDETMDEMNRNIGVGGGGRDHGDNGRGGRGRGRGRHNNDHVEIPYPQEIDFEQVPDNFPREKPYTAHISNLCFKIETESDLADKIEGLTRWRYKKKMGVNVTNARLGLDRNTGKRKGFGYVEFDTPEELMIFLNLNDGFSRLNGRDITISIAKSPRLSNSHNRNYNQDDRNRNNDGRSSGIDGSKFRGGRYNNATSPPTERRSLKLAPRSKAVDNSSTTKSNIFGSAKPRDGDSWRRKKEESKADTNAGKTQEGRENGGDASTTVGNGNGASSQGEERGGRGRGRGGGGRSRGGRGGRGGRGRDNNYRKNNDRRHGGGKDSDGWDKTEGGPSARPLPTNPPAMEPKETKKPTIANKFAALGFDSDSD
jgi:RNA recognition motif-containing protein